MRKRRKLKVNVNKKKIMTCSRRMRQDRLSVGLNGEDLEEVESCRYYLGVDVTADRIMEAEVSYREEERAKVLGTLRAWKEKSLSARANMGLFEGIVIPTAVYGCESRALNAKDRKRVDI